MEPLTTITMPSRDFGPDAQPNVCFWDLDLVAADDRFWGMM
ncbi:hypothetical protein [Jannaschia faecimaris]|nr:hypothetical protein [Jannaschia faecimaris]